METQTTEIQGKFDWLIPEVLTSFFQGEDAEAVYNSLDEVFRKGTSYDTKTRTVSGSHPFLAGRVDTLVRPLGIRVANLRDLSRPEVMNMVRDRYYADAPVLILRTMKDSYQKNLPLIKRIAEIAEEANGRLELPLIVSGIDFKPWPEDEQGYKIDIVKRDDFTAIHDERLEGKYNGESFLEVDKIGLPKFDKKGTRTWYARNEGLSGVYLDGSLDLLSGSQYLASSNPDGRVVLVSAEGANANFLKSYIKKLAARKAEFETQRNQYFKGMQGLKARIDEELKKTGQ